MADEAPPVIKPRLHSRIGVGMRKPHNWFQLVRFAAVGASGYVVNLAVFALLVEGLSVHYRVGAVVAFLVAVTNNFWWNRHWTFDAAHGHAGFQAARFLTVSLLAFGVNFAALELLVQLADVAEVGAQAIAIAVAMPVNFIGNKLWSFAS